jgi:hypothetical protein
MKTETRFVEACEALAEACEAVGRPDLAALCDRSGYWLNGGAGIDLISLKEIVDSCRMTLTAAFDSGQSLEEFVSRTTDEIMASMRGVGEAVVAASETGQDALIDKAAKLQAVAILTAGLFK